MGLGAGSTGSLHAFKARSPISEHLLDAPGVRCCLADMPSLPDMPSIVSEEISWLPCFASTFQKPGALGSRSGPGTMPISVPRAQVLPWRQEQPDSLVRRGALSQTDIVATC